MTDAGPEVDDETLTKVLLDAADAVGDALSGGVERGLSGARPGQYLLDLVADEAALEVLLRAGLSVLSEESGYTAGDGTLLAVLDPVDGSTNASQGIPYYSTSICVLDDEGPRVGVVVNHPAGWRYEAVRGGGARRDGQPIAPSGRTGFESSVVGLSGFPDRYLGWSQYRALGAASLELCAVAEGALDAFLLLGGARLYPWDYLGGLLICREAGASVAEAAGEDLVVREAVRRWPIAAATESLLDQAVASASGSGMRQATAPDAG